MSHFANKFQQSIRGIVGAFACLTALLLAGCGGGSLSGSGTPAVTQTIGSGGGEVINGNATLLINSGSTTTGNTTALYSVQQTNSYPADKRVVTGTAYNFTSSAATLTSTARISIRYNGGALPTGAQETSLQLYEVVSGAWTLVSDSTLDINNKVVSGTATTLGVYAVLASTIVTTSTGSTGSNRAAGLLFLANNGTSNTATLYSTTVGSSIASPITTQGGFGSELIGHAAFAPDAKSLVYDSQSSTGNLLVIAQADGSSVKSLFAGGLQTSNLQAVPRTPSYSADGKTVVFVYNQTGSDQIYTIKADGTGLTQITTNFTGASVDNPAYTKAGLIRFTSRVGTGTSATTQYNLVNTNGTGLTSTATFGPTVVPWYTYSPDGSKIVYVAQSSSKYDIFTINADGSTPTQITKLAAPSIGTARFSPDGTQIIFDATTTTNSTNSLYTIKADGTSQQALTIPVSGSLTLLDAH